MLFDLVIFLNREVSLFVGLLEKIKTLKNKCSYSKLYIVIGIDGSCDKNVLKYLESVDNINIIDFQNNNYNPIDYWRFGEVIDSVINRLDSDYAMFLHADCIPVKDNFLDIVYNNLSTNKLSVFMCKNGEGSGVQPVSAAFGVDIKWVKDNDISFKVKITRSLLYNIKVGGEYLGYEKSDSEGVYYFYEPVTIAIAECIKCGYNPCLGWVHHSFGEFMPDNLYHYRFEDYFNHLSSGGVLSYNRDILKNYFKDESEKIEIFEKKRKQVFEMLYNIKLCNKPLYSNVVSKLYNYTGFDILFDSDESYLVKVDLFIRYTGCVSTTALILKMIDDLHNFYKINNVYIFGDISSKDKKFFKGIYNNIKYIKYFNYKKSKADYVIYMHDDIVPYINGWIDMFVYGAKYNKVSGFIFGFRKDNINYNGFNLYDKAFCFDLKWCVLNDISIDYYTSKYRLYTDIDGYDFGCDNGDSIDYYLGTYLWYNAVKNGYLFNLGHFDTEFLKVFFCVSYSNIINSYSFDEIHNIDNDFIRNNVIEFFNKYRDFINTTYVKDKSLYDILMNLDNKYGGICGLLKEDL
jgi:hypothetical protein